MPKEVELAKDVKLVIENDNEEIVCDVCGVKNESTRTLCKSCSNYLKDEEEFE